MISDIQTVNLATVYFLKKRTANKRENSVRQLAFSGVPVTIATNRHSQFVTGTGKCGERVCYSLLYSSFSISGSNAVSSSLVRVMPLPILERSGDQSRISYFASLPFHEMRLSSLVHPVGVTAITPIFLMISYFNSAIVFTLESDNLYSL